MNAIEIPQLEARDGPRAPAREIPRLGLTPAEAAYAVGVSEDFFGKHIRGELRCVRRGAKVIFPVREIEAWLERSSARAAS